jgi:hypothetical protein
VAIHTRKPDSVRLENNHLPPIPWATLPWVSTEYSTVLIPKAPTHMKPGTGTTAGGVNWVGYLTTAENASLVLSYDLAVGGATIDGSLVGSTANDLAGQVRTFDATYSSKPASAPWTPEDAVFAFWIGINECAALHFRPCLD